jgi:hypothetical protein
VSELFAALAAHVSHLFFSLLRSVLRIIGVPFFFLRLVLVELAPWLVNSAFAAAPPNFAAPVRLMRPAGPVEILFFTVLFGAILADFAQVFISALTNL